MSIAKDIRTISELKTQTARLLHQVNEDRRPLIITQDGKPRAVVMDVDSYEELRNALGLLKLVAQGEEDFRKGRFAKHDVVFDRLERRLKERLRNARKPT